MSEKEQKVCTHCKGCIFAEYNTRKSGGGIVQEQIGCNFRNRLATFQSRGEAEQMEERDKAGNKLVFHKINRICNAYKDKDWLDKSCVDYIREARDKVESLVKTKLDFIIVVPQGLSEKQQKKALKASLESVKSQTIKPKKVIIASNSNANVGNMVEFLNKEMNQTGIKFRYIKMLYDRDYWKAFYEAVRKSENIWIGVIKAGEIVSDLFIESLDIAVNTRMQRFIMISDYDSIHGTAINRFSLKAAIRYFYTNNENGKPGNVVALVKSIAIETNQEQYLAEWGNYVQFT